MRYACLLALCAACMSPAEASDTWPDHRGDMRGACLQNGSNPCIADGTPTAALGRGISFCADPDTGMSRSAANTLVWNANQINFYTSDGTSNWFQYVASTGAMTLGGGQGMTWTPSGGWTASAASYVGWVVQGQDSVQDARLIGSADNAAEVGATVGTKYTDGQITGTTTRLVRAVTDADGTPAEKWYVDNQGGENFTGITQANLGTPANGKVIYCSDCTIANPCAGGGTGAIAKRLNGVWICN